MSLFGWFKSAPLPTKDPDDHTLTKSSTAWEVENYCFSCKGRMNHQARMAHFCNQCGTYVSTWDWRSRVKRKIYNGTGWVTQYKYEDGTSEVVNKEYKGGLKL